MNTPREARNPLHWPEWSPPTHEPASRLLCGQYAPTDADRAWAHAADASLQRQLDAWCREIHDAPEPELLDTDTALAAMAPQVPPRVTPDRVFAAVVVLTIAMVVAVLFLYGGA